MLRYIYRFLCLVALILIISYSIWLSVNISSRTLPFGNEYINIDRANAIKIIILAWIIGPPIALLLDWVVFCRGYDLVKLELIRHTHNLFINIWLAFIGVLMILFGVVNVFPAQ
jgi:hypothetical protein